MPKTKARCYKTVEGIPIPPAASGWPALPELPNCRFLLPYTILLFAPKAPKYRWLGRRYTLAGRPAGWPPGWPAGRLLPAAWLLPACCLHALTRILIGSQFLLSRI